MRKGLAISSVLHAGALLWGLITFNAAPFENSIAEAVPVDFVSATDFSKMTAGSKDAKKVEQAKPLVEKVAEPKDTPEPAQKITEKKEIVTASTAEPPPPVESKPEKEKKEKVETKADPIAEALKKEESKKEEKKPEAKVTPLPPKRPVHQQPKFDAAKVAALLDKRDPQRQAATGDVINRTASLGAPTGKSPELSQSELDALRARLMQLWNPPVGIRNASEVIIRIRVLLGRDRKLAGPPQVITSGQGAMFESARDSAIRAVFRAQPFDMLRAETYETWRDMEITFDPRDMFRG
jgi:colicin import membrane protein